MAVLDDLLAGERDVADLTKFVNTWSPEILLEQKKNYPWLKRAIDTDMEMYLPGENKPSTLLMETAHTEIDNLIQHFSYPTIRQEENKLIDIKAEGINPSKYYKYKQDELYMHKDKDEADLFSGLLGTMIQQYKSEGLFDENR